MNVAEIFRRAIVFSVLALLMSGCAKKITEDVPNTEAFSKESAITMVDVVDKTAFEAEEELKSAALQVRKRTD